jgi:pimeloyl-ACP methyl ester carboxylesterase
LLSDPHLGDITKVGPTQKFVSGVLAAFLTVGKVTQTGPALDVSAVQIDYVTQDRGKLIDASALVAFPTNGTAADGEKSTLDVIVVLHGTSGFTDSCAPSSDPSTAQLASAVASLGYVVVLPDYIGMRANEGPTGFLHPYLVAQPTAIASLDAVRAALKLLGTRDEPVCASTNVAVLGGSQGGHAALMVDRFAPYYAPELHLVGTVATVPPADVVGESMHAISNDVHATQSVAAFVSAAGPWYGQSSISSALAPPLDTALPAAMAARCDPSDVLNGKTHDQIFTPQLLAAAKDRASFEAFSPWGCYAKENTVAETSIARVPTSASYGILTVFGEQDEIVSTDIERAGYPTLCGQGMPMQFLECTGAKHVDTTKWSLPEGIDFMRDRFAGKPFDLTQCKVAPPVTCRGTPTN